jgi:hypothetical protein
MLISLIVLFYMSYSKILRSFFQLFDCTKLNGFFTEPRLQGALDVKCLLSSSSDPHDARYQTLMLTLALPVAILYLLPVPIVALWKLQGSDRTSDQTLTVYGFLYSGYKEEYWYWEILVLLRKISVAAISVFLSAEVSSANDLQVNSSQYQQGLLATLVISVALYVQLKLEPFEGDDLNGVESMGLVVSVVSLYLGLWTFYGSKDNDVVDTIITVLIFGINGCWFLYTIVCLFKEYKIIKYLKSTVKVITCRRKTKKEDAKSKDEGSDKVKGTDKKTNKQNNSEKAGSVIELPHIQVSNPLLSLLPAAPGSGFVSVVGANKREDSKSAVNKEVKGYGSAKVKMMISPLKR